VLELTPDELLSTTRAVRRRLDLEQPVDRAVLEECLRLAQQAPTGSYRQNWHFVVVTEPDLRAGLADLWRQGAEKYLAGIGDPEAIPGMMGRVVGGVFHLRDHLHEVPVHVIPCIEGRIESGPVALHAASWGSLLPAVWNFCLAARARGLGTCWTTLHVFYEQEAAEVLGIPENVVQGALIPVAYTKGIRLQARASSRPRSHRPPRELVNVTPARRGSAPALDLGSSGLARSS
jgi:nitroreductase